MDDGRGTDNRREVTRGRGTDPSEPTDAPRAGDDGQANDAMPIHATAGRGASSMRSAV
jgi:hypothetical protein